MHLLLVTGRTPDQGASALEYAIVVALLAVAVVTAVALLGDSLGNLFDQGADQVTTP